ncbi:WhiB family transcriptional regulator [Microbacterium sp. 77mftsu3.1]|uniref:WhiB family transcriptional regulator n=1 Tax=Microbacterium sp. 77mftsu3.1 TaxID=1761802 RepID=UPI00087FC99E|nr:WhiB family transcriptional regulator [Microbacterium sp. 77mftsu3.1]SDG22608.1 Transcription factor WhiB [Microbacterium sp. 77mftsu3.1]
MVEASRIVSAGERVVAVSASPASTRWTGIASLITPEPWVADARCAETDPELFHPPVGGSSQEAKKICADCPVQAECLAYALRTNQTESIWGGKSARERRTMRSAAA